MTDRKRAAIAGIFILAGIAAGLLSVVPAVDGPDYLTQAFAHRNAVLRGAFFQCLMVPAYVGFALSLYPVLKRYNASLALGFVVLRIAAAMLQLVGAMLLPLLLVLSREFVRAGAPDSSYFQTLGTLAITARDLVNHVAMIAAVCLSGLLLFTLLIQTALVPRWLSGWGFAGTCLTMLASLGLLCGLLEVLTPLYIGLNLPLALQDVTFALWLIVKGFTSSAAVVAK